MSTAAAPKYITLPTYVAEADGVPPTEAELPVVQKPVRKVAETTRLVYAAFAEGLAPFEPANPHASTTSRLLGER